MTPTRLFGPKVGFGLKVIILIFTSDNDDNDDGSDNNDGDDNKTIQTTTATMPSTHKPSLSLPATAPNTPANARTNRYVVPVTPQRSLHSKSLSLAQNKPQNQNQNRAQSQSAYQPRTRTVHHSPSTPSASPYTPLSLRSVNTSNTYSTPYSYSSSNVTTPGSAHSNIVGKRLILAGLSSAEDKEKAGKDKSLADIAENWRSRANENGIRVSSSECGIDADDEGQCCACISLFLFSFGSNCLRFVASDRTNASRVKIPLGRGFQGAYTRIPPLPHVLSLSFADF